MELGKLKQGSVLIPQKIVHCFESITQTFDGENVLTEGAVTCCNSHEFEVMVVGKVKSGLFSGVQLEPENDEMVLELCCKNCGKIFSGFDSTRDGYEHCGEESSAKIKPRRFDCKKCSDSNFAVSIKYEYPDSKELDDLGITEKDNAFTWIWVTLVCNTCGAKYSDFIDYETA